MSYPYGPNMYKCVTFTLEIYYNEIKMKKSLKKIYFYCFINFHNISMLLGIFETSE